ncbi:MnmC family methyltransferase [Niabella hibiscisoli]|uniref:MnmC family methyltransferase n=1 Tax=Niabella hibiscisoli TaxID=1825928 RepID=UPI001F0D43BB|nr:MnmC family methyltransferase [Niabella hibiscisoli]MCH5720354.1 MnmC family methyltransferase [Niabella hibiscisoli]
MNTGIEQYNFTEQFDMIYFDAFAPEDQEELWQITIFEKLLNALQPGGVMVTYCSKTIVRRALEAAGFVVEKIPGPWGKREIVRATRP